MFDLEKRLVVSFAHSFKEENTQNTFMFTWETQSCIPKDEGMRKISSKTKKHQQKSSDSELLALINLGFG